MSSRSIFAEIRGDDRAFALLLSIAAGGEQQGGEENLRIAALTGDMELAASIRAHGLDEEGHARLFRSLLSKCGLEETGVPAAANYCMRLEKLGIGLSHRRLRSDRPLDDEEILEYLAHSRVTEQRAADEVARMLDAFRDDPILAPALRMIARDERLHLDHCHREIGRLAARRPDLDTAAALRRVALVEIEVYREVGLDFVARMAEILNWSRPRRLLMRAAVRTQARLERHFALARMTRIRDPRCRSLAEIRRRDSRTAMAETA